MSHCKSQPPPALGAHTFLAKIFFKKPQDASTRRELIGRLTIIKHGRGKSSLWPIFGLLWEHMLALMRTLTKCGVCVLPSVSVSAISRSDTPILSQSKCRTIVSVSRPQVRACAVRQGKANVTVKTIYTIFQTFSAAGRDCFWEKLFALLSVYSDKQLLCLRKLTFILMLI